MSKSIKLLFAIGIPLFILLIPTSWIGLEGLTIVEQRVIAIFFFAALFWILEPIPIYATSLMIIFLLLILVSTKGLIFLIDNPDTATLGKLMNYKDIMSTFASPIILLFLGGFFLAMAATKYRLDQNLAKVLLKPFGENPKYVMLGLMIITAIFSMFMSNTATTAMMLSILMPVLGVFLPGDKGKIGFTLAIPIAANIGGIGTPIGTPPNAVALKYLTGDHMISFGKWMLFGVPYVIIVLAISWFILIYLYPVKTEKIKLSIEGTWMKSTKAYIVYITFIGTILLWLTDFAHGMNSYIVAMIPVAVFSSLGIINKSDLKNISWDVLWLVSGGIALGLSMETSGLAERLIAAIPFGDFSPFLIVILATLVATLMANFMSHTAGANLLLPLVATLGISLSGLAEFGGMQMIILAVTISCSLGMALPISTPPNALAFATGTIETKQMAKPGIIIGIIGLLINYALMYILNLAGYFTI
jgi:solute carrier family 13 (sodium-dependent dicarboxylate transporter), member 2/3/5